MKRLLCILSCMNAGGAETFLMKLYREIDRKAYQFDFAVNSREEGFYDKEISSLGGKIFQFPSKSESFLGYVKGIKKIVQENHYEYVLRITSNAMGFLDLAIAKKAGAKICIARSSNSSGGGRLKSRLSHTLGKFLFKKFVDVKIAPSSEAAVYTFGEKDYKRGFVHLLPNGFDLDYYKYTESGRVAFRKEFGISPNQKVVGHVGRFSVQKNHFFLLSFFKEYLKTNPDAVLLLVGKGELETEVQRKVSEMKMERNVLLAGVRSDMPSVYSAMDVFVFPSLYEGMPNAVLEAQACGLNCIVSENVTKEANVTNGIHYLPIENGCIRMWVDLIGKCKNRILDANRFFEEYDIKKVAMKFEKIVLGDFT